MKRVGKSGIIFVASLVIVMSASLLHVARAQHIITSGVVNAAVLRNLKVASAQFDNQVQLSEASALPKVLKAQNRRLIACADGEFVHDNRCQIKETAAHEDDNSGEENASVPPVLPEEAQPIQIPSFPIIKPEPIIPFPPVKPVPLPEPIPDPCPVPIDLTYQVRSSQKPDIIYCLLETS